MSIYQISEIVSNAREVSSYYRKLYENVPPNALLTDLPLTNSTDYWLAMKSTSTHNWNGIFFKSGGTTGNPKYSVFSKEEWIAITSSFGRGLAAAGIQSGSRVANLFFSGDLYASFLFITKSLEEMPVPILQFPLSGSGPPESILHSLQTFAIDTIVGVPTHLLTLTQQESYRRTFPKLKRILFGGEALYDDQEILLKDFFGENIQLSSVGYASVDAGHLGFSDPQCKRGEHYSFGGEVILEIIDEATGLPIEETFKPGKLYATNLTRKQMPILRYPIGDRAQWCAPANQNRKFQILGRSEEAARVGPVSLFYEDASRILSRYHIGAFQMKLTHHDGKDQLTLRCVVPEGISYESLTLLERKIFTNFHKERPEWLSSEIKGLIHPLHFEWIEFDELKTNSRTGKLVRVNDERT